MNRDRLREVADRIELEDRFSYGEFVSGNSALDVEGCLDLVSDLRRLNHCGTQGCIAGWAGLIALEQGDLPQQEEHAWPSFAQRWLGLTLHEAGRLFFADVVPEWFDRRHSDAPDAVDTFSMTAVEAAKMLRQIADGEIAL